MMTSIQLDLPESVKEYIDELVSLGTFQDPSAYLHALIENDRAMREKARIEALLIEGLDSGPATPVTEETWKEIRREGLALVAARKSLKDGQ